MEKMAVVDNRVIIDPIKEGENETEGGIILPESVRQTDHNGVVISVGPNADDRIKEGTRVVFDPKTGAEVRVNKRVLLVMRDIDLLYFHVEETPSLN